jgi:DNA-binding MarR family transcriptional regulator
MDGAASEAWATMRALTMAQRGAVMAIAAEFSLSPTQLFALRALQPGEPAPMSDLASVLRCDASNVTGIVNRLQERGLVQRHPAPDDRRVKHLVLTDEGRALRETLAARMDQPPAGFEELSSSEAAQLRDLLLKVADGSRRRA